MKYSKVIIISSHEFDSRINTLFRVEQLAREGINIEYWNVAAITYHETIRAIDNNITTISITDKSDFTTKVQGNIGTRVLYIVYMNYGIITYSCYRILSRFKTDILYCINGVLPKANFKRYRTYSPKRIISGLKNRLAYLALKTPLISAVKYELVTCRNAGRAYKTNSRTISLSFNSTDYEESLNPCVCSIKEPYILFIDQYLPLHPDNKIFGEKGLDVELYYSQMNQLFDRLENLYNCKVIIAAHPASLSYADNNPFGNRQLITGRTNELVKGCQFVVAHFSTAIYFAVIYHKPLLIVSSNDIKHNMSRAHFYCELFAKELRSSFIMLENLGNFKLEVVNEKAYKSFLINYITNYDEKPKSNFEVMKSIINGEYE